MRRKARSVGDNLPTVHLSVMETVVGEHSVYEVTRTACNRSDHELEITTLLSSVTCGTCQAWIDARTVQKKGA